MTPSEKLNYISEILSEERYSEQEKLAAIKGMLYPGNKKGRIQKYSLSEIAKQVESHTKISLDKINKHKRDDFDVLMARQFAHYKAIKFSQVPLTVIGMYFGCKDHASVIHSKKAISGYLKVDKVFRSEHEEFLNS